VSVTPKRARRDAAIVTIAELLVHSCPGETEGELDRLLGRRRPLDALALHGLPRTRAWAISDSVPQPPPTAINASPDATTARLRACPTPVTTTWSTHSFAAARDSPGSTPIVVPPADSLGRSSFAAPLPITAT